MQGDVRALGMAGATLGLGDSLTAAIQNPAGLAMTVPGGGFMLYGNTIGDQNIQPIGNAVSNINLALGGNLYPWGVAVGSSSTFHEGMTYNGSPIDVHALEWRLSLARILFDNRVALGANFIVGDGSQQFGTTTRHSYAIGVTLSALLQLPSRWLVGLTYTPAMRYAAPSNDSVLAGITNPFQDIHSPERFGFGLGWIPNRFFRAGLSFNVLGTSPNTALLKDQNAIVGSTITFQPRFGAAYTLVDFHNLEIRGLAGIYWESSRIALEPSRLHATAGVEIRPWVLELGFALDVSAGYQNILLMGGVDVIKLMQRLEFIPSDRPMARGGTLPRMAVMSEEGLPRAINPSWKPGVLERHSIIDIGKQIPGNIERKLEKTGDEIQGGFDRAVKGIKSRFKERREKQRKQAEREGRWRRDPQRE